MCAIELQYPLGSYSIDNPPSNETLKSDLATVQVAVNAGEDAIGGLSASKLDSSYLDTDGTLAANSDTKIPSQKAVKTYADTEISTGISSIQDWKTLPALAWVSTDGSTNVVNATGNMTATLSPGMRFKTQQDQALTAYWNLDASSASQVGSFNGTDTAITYTAGKFSNAATFNGTTSKIVIADNASLKPTGEFTIGCWFKKTGVGTTKGIFQTWSGNTSYAGIQLIVDTTNVLYFSSGNNTGTVAGVNFTQLYGKTNVADNAYHYCVVSFRNNYVQIYLDGKLEISSYCMTPAYAATNYVRIGCYNAAASDALFFDGQIDDLFLINGYALDEKTIKAKYDAQTAQGTGAITIDKYALITAVGAYSAPNTPITIWGGTDYSLDNATITSPYYATVSQPFGFDRNPAKWMVEIYNKALLANMTQASPVANTWYNIGSLSITVPIGKWSLGYENSTYSTRAAASVMTVFSTLSTANNSESDYRNTTSVISTPVTAVSAMLSRAVPISLISKTTYYLNEKTDQTGTTGISVLSDSYGATIIRATSTHL